MLLQNNATQVGANAIASEQNELIDMARIGVKQLNLHHCKGATNLICNSINMMHTKKHHLICLIQEHWVVKNQKKGFDSNKMNVFYSKSRTNFPRA